MNTDIEKVGGKPEDKPQGPEVTFQYVNSLQTVKFKADWDTTLDSLWQEALVLLEEPRRAEDRVQAADGTDLMPYLSLTLRQLQDRKLIKGHSFQIVGPTGGASA
jgi:hypothetical protein